MRHVWVLGLFLCLSCEPPQPPAATPVAPVQEDPVPLEPAAPRKPAPPKTKAKPEEPGRWVYPNQEMFEDGAIVSMLGSQRLAAIRKRMGKDMSVRIEVHTNPRGSASYNLKMSQERAKSLRGVLSQERMELAERIESVGRGETTPATTGDASRVEIELFKAPLRDE